jgi:hypothetical protein
MSVHFRAQIAAVRMACLALHKLLISSVRHTYEREHGRIESSGELLNLVAYDAAFAWLHPLSELIVALDELLDIPEHDDTDAAAVRVELSHLLAHSGEHFAQPYLAALQSDSHLVVAHGALQRALAALPAAPPTQHESLRDVRLAWPERASQQRRK